MCELFEEEAGLISKDKCWVIICGEYMYTEDSEFGVVLQMLAEWRHDKHLVG